MAALRFVADECCDFAGVILVRYPGNGREQLANAVLKLVREQGERLYCG